MCNIAKSIIIGFIVFSIIYLMGSFYSASFDISQWKEMCRYAVVVLGGVLFFAAFIISIIELNTSKNN